jgi:hypothetical protein
VERGGKMLKHFRIGQANKAKSAGKQEGVTLSIFLLLKIAAVVASIHLNDQLELRAVKIKDKCLVGMLTAESEASQPIATQCLPEYLFCLCRYHPVFPGPALKFW